MLAAPSSRHPHQLCPEHKLTIPNTPAVVARRHSTISSLHTSRPLRSSPLAGPSIAVGQDGTLKLGAASAPPASGGCGRHLSPLAEFSVVAEPGDDDDIMTQRHRRRRTLGAVFSKINFPSSSSNASSSSSVNSVSDQPAGKPRRRARSSSAHGGAPPVPLMPTWAHNTMPMPMPNRKSQNLSPSPRSQVSRRLESSPSLSSRAHSTTRYPPSTGSRRSMIETRATSPVSGRITPSTSRNPEENWLTQAAPPRFTRLGLQAQGVIMPVSAREARRRSTMSTSSTRAKSLDVLTPLAPAHTRVSSRSSIASTSTHGRIPRRPATSPSCPMPASSSSLSPSGHLRSRTSSLASASSSHGSVDRCVTPPLTMSAATSTSSVSFAGPPIIIVGMDELGVQTMSPSSAGVQIQLNDVPVPPEAYPGYDHKGKGKAIAADVTSVASAGSIGSVVSQASYASYASGYSAFSAESLSVGPSIGDSSYGSQHVRAATAPAEMQAQTAAQPRAQEREKGTLSKKKSMIGRVWKQVVRSVTVRG